METTTVVELLGANSKRDNVTKLLSILAGEGRDRLPLGLPGRGSFNGVSMTKSWPNCWLGTSKEPESTTWLRSSASVAARSWPICPGLVPSPDAASSTGASKKPVLSTSRVGHWLRLVTTSGSMPRRFGWRCGEPVSKSVDDPGSPTN